MGQRVAAAMAMARLMASSSAQSGQATGKNSGVGVAVGDELVLEVLDDVAALAVELQHAAAAGGQLHGLADVVVVAHPAGRFL